MRLEEQDVSRDDAKIEQHQKHPFIAGDLRFPVPVPLKDECYHQSMQDDHPGKVKIEELSRYGEWLNQDESAKRDEQGEDV